jgi:hypothetical protein
MRSLELPLLDADRVAGPFCLLDRRSLTIDAVPGLVVRVRNGAVAITGDEGSMEYLVHAGMRFVSDSVGTIVIRPLARTEIVLDWPTDELHR